jgi:hypothetical protein
MSALDDLLSERLRQVLQELFLVLEVIGTLLIGLKMPFDFGEESLVNLSSLSELFKHGDLLLEALVGSVHTVEQVGHITKHDGVEADSEEHPRDGENSLLDVLSVDIAEPDCG